MNIIKKNCHSVGLAIIYSMTETSQPQNGQTSNMLQSQLRFVRSGIIIGNHFIWCRAHEHISLAHDKCKLWAYALPVWGTY